MIEGADGAFMATWTQGGDIMQERRDYINRVNTELMSGRGLDIIALDVLPFHRKRAHRSFSKFVQLHGCGSPTCRQAAFFFESLINIGRPAGSEEPLFGQNNCVPENRSA